MFQSSTLAVRRTAVYWGTYLVSRVGSPLYLWLVTSRLLTSSSPQAPAWQLCWTTCLLDVVFCLLCACDVGACPQESRGVRHSLWVVCALSLSLQLQTSCRVPESCHASSGRRRPLYGGIPSVERLFRRRACAHLRLRLLGTFAPLRGWRRSLSGEPRRRSLLAN